MKYDPLTVKVDQQGNATIMMNSRRGILEMYIPAERQGITPTETIKAVIDSLNEGIAYLEEDTLLYGNKNSKYVN